MRTPAQQLQRHLSDQVGRVVLGADGVIAGLCLALVARGHVLLQGVPGLGKTLLAKALAGELGGRFKRIQCTADLMPSDMTGIHVYHEQKQRFVLMPGPLFADVVLVDEINRTGPKTQSALLEAMEEASVTIDRNTYPLSERFFVIATQNPHEFEGTYPLPESQLDRFLLRLDMGYPPRDMEEQVLRRYDLPGGGHGGVERAVAPLPDGLLEAARRQVAQVHVADAVYRYVADIGIASRSHPQVSLGLSTRGVLSLMRCARVQAALQGEPYVTPDAVKAVAPAVMAHRLMLAPDAALDGVDGGALVTELLGQIPVPRS